MADSHPLDRLAAQAVRLHLGVRGTSPRANRPQCGKPAALPWFVCSAQVEVAAEVAT